MKNKYYKQFERGHIYDVALPEVSLSTTEMGGHHRCIVISNDDLNDQHRGLIVIPMTSARENNREKFGVGNPPRNTWVRVLSAGEYAFVQCEQIRYVDRSKVGKSYGSIDITYDLPKVEEMVKKLVSAVNR
jgi:mRNA-degrading endonuclease toxin of MazEF toxin-antitoxin module